MPDSCESGIVRFRACQLLGDGLKTKSSGDGVQHNLVFVTRFDWVIRSMSDEVAVTDWAEGAAAGTMLS